jgi:hypothetical protein
VDLDRIFNLFLETIEFFLNFLVFLAPSIHQKEQMIQFIIEEDKCQFSGNVAVS